MPSGDHAGISGIRTADNGTFGNTPCCRGHSKIIRTQILSAVVQISDQDRFRNAERADMRRASQQFYRIRRQERAGGMTSRPFVI